MTWLRKTTIRWFSFYKVLLQVFLQGPKLLILTADEQMLLLHASCVNISPAWGKHAWDTRLWFSFWSSGAVEQAQCSLVLQASMWKAQIYV